MGSSRRMLAVVLLVAGGCGAGRVQDPKPDPVVETVADEPVQTGEQEQQPLAPAPEMEAFMATFEAAEPEPPPQPRAVEFDAIASKNEPAGLVTVQARILTEHTPAKGGGEEPCVPWTRLMNTGDSVLPQSFSVEGVVTGHPGMVKEVPYTFVLELEEGYGAKLQAESCNPEDLGIKLVDCLDCDEQKVPTLTIPQLKAYQLGPGFVLLEAYFTSTNTPGPCPKMSQCEPAVETTTLSASAESGSDYVMVTGHPSEPKKLKKGTPYIFLLQLHEDYEYGLKHPTSDPRVNNVKLRRVVGVSTGAAGQGSFLESQFCAPLAPANDDWARKCKKGSDCVLTTFTTCCSGCTCTAEPYAINRKILENQQAICSVGSCAVIYTDDKPCPPCPQIPDSGASCVKGTCTVNQPAG